MDLVKFSERQAFSKPQGKIHAVLLVKSPRSTQHTEQCTPYFRLNPFALVALAIYVAKSQEMSHLLAS